MDEQLELFEAGMRNSRKRLRQSIPLETQLEAIHVRRRLPPGLIWDEAGRIQKDPDAQVVSAIELVFQRFDQAQEAAEGSGTRPVACVSEGFSRGIYFLGAVREKSAAYPIESAWRIR